jgi:hypothetical protein
MAVGVPAVGGVAVGVGEGGVLVTGSGVFGGVSDFGGKAYCIQKYTKIKIILIPI